MKQYLDKLGNNLSKNIASIERKSEILFKKFRIVEIQNFPLEIWTL